MSIEVAEVNYFTEGRGTSTPWGRAQYAQQLDRGVTWYGTAGHGGLSVSTGWALKNLTPHARFLGEFWGSGLWYEEDVACQVVFLEHPELYQKMFGSTPNKETLEASVRKWYPKYFDEDFRAASMKAQTIPLPKELERGDTIILHAFGAPNNERAYTLLGATNNGKGALVEDDCLGRYKITAASIQNSMTRVERNGETVWERP